MVGKCGRGAFLTLCCLDGDKVIVFGEDGETFLPGLPPTNLYENEMRYAVQYAVHHCPSCCVGKL